MFVEISFIIPYFNAGSTILQCLKSIEQSASMLKYEIIIIDDCSNIDSSEFLVQFVSMPNIRLHRNSENMGAGVCRNIGLSLARGEYLHFIDADDILCEEVITSFSANRYMNAEIYLFHYKTIRENRFEPAYAADELIFKIAGYRDLFHRVVNPAEQPLIMNLVSFVWNKFISREYAQKINLSFSDTYCFNDVYGCWRLMLFCERLVVLDAIGICYRVNHSPGQLSNQYGERRIQSLRAFKETDALLPMDSAVRPYYEAAKVKTREWLKRDNPELANSYRLDIKDFVYDVDKLSYIYGTGSKARQFFENVSTPGQILGFLDSDNSKSGSECCSKLVLSPADIAANSKIIIASSYFTEIATTLELYQQSDFSVMEELAIRLV